MIIVSLLSCSANKRLIGKSQTEYGKVNFYEINSSDDKSHVTKVYADVNNGGIKRYYSFYPDKILMTEEKAKQLSYTILFNNLPDNYDKSDYNQLSRLDTIVFEQAEIFLNSSKYSHLKKPQGAKGYEIEINYYHGFPRNRIFRPL